MTIDLTSPEKAAAYLASLPPGEIIPVPDRWQREPLTAAQDALRVAFDCPVSDLVPLLGHETTAASALEALAPTL